MIKIAVPCDGQEIASHFGHAGQFAFFEGDPDTGAIVKEAFLDAPPHQPGLLPKWVASHGANVVLAGGMGARAVQLFQAQGVEVALGVTATDPKGAAEEYLKGTLAYSLGYGHASSCRSACRAVGQRDSRVRPEVRRSECRVLGNVLR